MKEIIFEHFVTIWRCVVGKCQYFAIYSLCCLFYSFVAPPISLLLLPCPCYTSLPPPTMPLLSLPYHRCLSNTLLFLPCNCCPYDAIVVPPIPSLPLLYYCYPSHAIVPLLCHNCPSPAINGPPMSLLSLPLFLLFAYGILMLQKM